MAETGAKIKPAASPADHFQSSRRQELNERLLRWGKWFTVGTAVGLSSYLLLPVSVPLAATVAVGGGIAEGVGTVGIIGNVLKRLKHSNR